MNRNRLRFAVLGLIAVLALALAAGAGAAPSKKGGKAGKSESEHVQPPVETSEGSLEQLPGRLGCLSSGKAANKLCGRARALKGAGPGVGSRAIAISPDGRNVYATTRDSSSVITFHRNRLTGQLRQLPPSASGCISGQPIPGCTAGRALKWPDVVVVSPDGKNVYVGDFAGSGVISFSRAGQAGALTQLSGTAGCITEAGAEGCAKGTQMNHVEGMAINPSGSAVYTAAAFSSAVGILTRDSSTGALSQSGCITIEKVEGCALGYEFGGINAFSFAPDGSDVYATSLTSNSLTTFRAATGGVGISQPPGPERQVSKEKGPGKETVPAAEGTPSPDGCTVYLRSPGCGFGRAMQVPEGLDVSPDGTSVYVAAFQTGAIDVFDRDPESGVVTQKSGERGCVAPHKVRGCTLGRALGGAGSLVVSPDGKNVYSTSQLSSAVDVFRRIK